MQFPAAFRRSAAFALAFCLLLGASPASLPTDALPASGSADPVTRAPIPLVAASTDAARRTDLPAFGMSVIHYHEAPVAQARQAGASSVLVGLLWSDIEPVRTNPPTYHWGVADRNIDIAVRHGLEPFVLFTGAPDWAHTGDYKILTPEGRAALAEMVAAAAARYQGQARLYSLFNEPDCNGPTAPPWGSSPSSCYGNYGAQYTALLKEVYPALKAANPDALLAIGGVALDNQGPVNSFAAEFLDDLLRSGGGDYFDLMNFHYYTEFSDLWNRYGRDVFGKTAYIRDVMARHGVDKPVVLTEIGRSGLFAGNEGQADYVVQGLARAFAAGNDLVLWYELSDEGSIGYQFGLIDGEGKPKPGYTAYQVLSQKLTGLTSNGCAVSRYPGVEAYLFEAPQAGRREVVAWSIDGLIRTVSLTSDTVTRTLRTGETTVLTDAADGSVDGQVVVPVGPMPTILSMVPKPVTSPVSVTGSHRLFFPTVGRGGCNP